MHTSSILSIIFLLLFSFCSSKCAFAQGASDESEAQLLAKIDVLKTENANSPIDKLNKLLAIIESCEQKSWLVACLYAYTLKAEVLLASSKINEAEALLPRLMTSANALNEPIILIRLELVDLNIRDSKGLFADITEQHTRLLVKANNIESPRLAGEIYHDVGDSQYQFLDYTGALVSLNKAYESYQLANDLSAVGSVLNTLANLNNTLENTDIALDYLRKALAVSYQLKNKFATSIVLYNMSVSYSLSENLEEARNYMQQAMQMSAELDDEVGVAWAKKELARYDIDSQNWHAALARFNEIEPILMQSGSALSLFETRIGQAQAYLGLNELDLAAKKSEQSRLLLENLKDPTYTIKLGKLDADIAYANNNFQRAFDILAQNYAFADKVRVEEKQKEIEKQLIRFNSALKEKENQALITENKLKNLQIEQQEAQQAAQQRIWWLMIGFSALILVFIGFMLFIQIKNRNHFKAMALNDHLTKAPNRRAILDYAEIRFQESSRTQQPLMVGIIDIDNFKKLNDTHGHDVGDDVLVAFATACKNVIRQYDKFGRYGGEEWLFVFANTTAQDISVIFVRIRDEFNKIIQQRHQNFNYVTFSMGVASYSKDVDHTLQQLINRADKLLYQAKAQGKDQVGF
ncbi:tetratricopeptide repeat-containing diguanylate cyclase [Paraglaciecola mesophila]|uniref:diguanylate cyclase n=1 Tax=Paraglaciecola mesophila TaxID=197222 RepID=A0ABU9T203_9ALTE